MALQGNCGLETFTSQSFGAIEPTTPLFSCIVWVNVLQPVLLVTDAVTGMTPIEISGDQGSCGLGSSCCLVSPGPHLDSMVTLTGFVFDPPNSK